MTTEQKIKFAALAGICALATHSYLKTRQEQRAIRRNIASKLTTDITAIHIATGRIQERISNGEYTTIDQAMDALKFETIVIANDL